MRGRAELAMKGPGSWSWGVVKVTTEGGGHACQLPLSPRTDTEVSPNSPKCQKRNVLDCRESNMAQVGLKC